MAGLADDFDPSMLRLIDLNKLLVFMVVYLERSASGAALHLGLKQPAISNTLCELRRIFDDELFVRQGKGFKVTARAETIFNILKPAISLAGELKKYVKPPFKEVC